jgi:hypothetical protein
MSDDDRSPGCAQHLPVTASSIEQRAVHDHATCRPPG